MHLHFRRIQHTVVPRFPQLQPDTPVTERLHAQIRVVLLAAAVLHHQLHRQFERPTVSLRPQQFHRLRHTHRESLLVLVHFVDEALPIDPSVHFPPASANQCLKALFGIGRQQIFRLIQRKNQTMMGRAVKVAQHKGGGSQLSCCAKVGQ